MRGDRNLGIGSAPERWIIAAIIGTLGLAAEGRAQLNMHGLQTWEPGECCAIPVETELYFGRATAIGDFNEDGFPDLVIGVPGATLIGGQHAGKVVVLPGTEIGPSMVGLVVLTEADLGGTPGLSDHFGNALAVGDFNADGADDLAIGVPGDDNEGGAAAGGVYTILGRDAASGGSGMFGDQAPHYWSYATVSVGGWADPQDRFGESLASGDFDGDGFDDLVIGVPFDNVNAGLDNAGSLTLLRGTTTALGLTPFHGITLNCSSPSVPCSLSSGATFAYALAAGDFDGNGTDDLAIGVPGQGVGEVDFVGAVIVLEFENPGSGLEIVDSEIRYQGAGIPGAPELFDYYGWTLGAGDFDGDGADDLVVGAPFEGVGANGWAGAFAVLEGIPGSGIEVNGALWTQDDLDGQESREGEALAAALAVGDFDADGLDDLVLGAPGEERFLLGPGGLGWYETGAVHVVPGSAAGLAPAATRTWVGTPGDLSIGDGFGLSLATGRLRGGSDSLAIGSLNWNTGGDFQVGRVSVLFSDHLFSDGLETGNAAKWSAVTP
jgi:hypothetical protein